MRVSAKYTVAGLVGAAGIVAAAYALMPHHSANAGVCSDIAAYIGGQSDIAAGNFEGTVLQYIDGRMGSPIDGAVPQTMGGDFEANEADYEAFKVALRQQFHPSPQLEKEMAELVLYGEIEISSPDEYGIHALTSTSGSANCTSYMFFDVERGRNAELISQEPEDAADENCYNARDAYLATGNGKSVFIANSLGSDDVSETISVTPWNGREWQSPCHVNVVIDRHGAAVEPKDGDAVGERKRWRLLSVKAQEGPVLHN